jgi:hypothetical protein
MATSYALNSEIENVKKQLRYAIDNLKTLLKQRVSTIEEERQLEYRYASESRRIHNFFLDAFVSSKVAASVTEFEPDDDIWDAADSHRRLTNTIRSDLGAIEQILEALETPPVPSPPQEFVLPMAVFDGTRDYIKKIVIQINGCYEHKHFDACAMMIRRLVEMLIIEVYKHPKREAEIQTGGIFKMLGALIDQVLLDFSLGKDTKKGLPLINELGNRSAHAPTFIAHQNDIDRIQGYLRVIADELLCLAALK